MPESSTPPRESWKRRLIQMLDAEQKSAQPPPPPDHAHLVARGRAIKRVFRSLSIEASLEQIHLSPSKVRYEVKVNPTLSTDCLEALPQHLSGNLNLEGINIVCPLPGAPHHLGIDLPRDTPEEVTLSEVLASKEWQTFGGHIPIPLGKGFGAQFRVPDLAELPHLLIAGNQGSGHSSFLESIVTTLVLRFSPSQLRLIIIDPWSSNFVTFDDIPHLIAPAVTEPENALATSKWLAAEAEQRCQYLARAGTTDLAQFNSRPKPASTRPRPSTSFRERVPGLATPLPRSIIQQRKSTPPLPRLLSPLVVVITELATLSSADPVQLEDHLSTITRLGRSVGIYCLIATAFPTVDVLTSRIKATIPARVAFRVNSRVESRTILDAAGAQALTIPGDLLYLDPNSAKLQNLQAPFLSHA